MRSWRDRLALAVMLAAAVGCIDPIGEQPPDAAPADAAPDPCRSSYLTYDNFGAPFIADWCRGCHASGLPPDMRQNSPLAVNFDDLDDARTWAERIVARAGVATTMPPAGGPSPEERALLVEWVGCGVR